MPKPQLRADVLAALGAESRTAAPDPQAYQVRCDQNFEYQGYNGESFGSSCCESPKLTLNGLQAMLLEVLDVHHERKPVWASRQETLLLQVLEHHKHQDQQAHTQEQALLHKAMKHVHVTQDGAEGINHKGMQDKGGTDIPAHLKHGDTTYTTISTKAPVEAKFTQYTSDSQATGVQEVLSPSGELGERSKSECSVRSKRSLMEVEGAGLSRRVSQRAQPALSHSGSSRFGKSTPKLSPRVSPRAGPRASTDTFDKNIGRLGKFVRSKYFSQGAALIVCMDMVCNGILASFLLSHALTNIGSGGSAQQDDIAYVVECIFFALYTVELTLRVAVFKRSFLTGEDGVWNFFDIFLVASTGIALVALTSHVNLTYLRIMRVFKQIMKALRVLRVVKFFEDLRIIMLSIGHSMRSFFWALVTLVLIMYLCAIVFCEGIAVYLHGNLETEISESIITGINDNWGSLGIAMLSEYKAITGGAPWGTFLEPLQAAGPAYVAIFLLYIAFLVIAVLRLLTGIFVQQAASAGKLDMERSIQQNIVNLFNRIDDDGSGSITYDELQHHLKEKEVTRYLEQLQFTHHDADKIFHLMALGANDEVDIHDFIATLQSFKGAARKIDVALMQGWIKEVAMKLDAFMEYVAVHFEGTCEVEVGLEDLMPKATSCSIIKMDCDSPAMKPTAEA